MSEQPQSIAALPQYHCSQITGDSTHLVLFGQSLASHNLQQVITAITQLTQNNVIFSQYQPLEHLSPALIASGVGEVNKDGIAELVEQFGVEAVLVHNPPTINSPGVLLMDMDSTAIEIECIDEIAILAGVGEQVAAVTKRAMQGELDFSESLHHRVATLENADESILKQVIETLPLMPGLEVLVATLKAKGWVVAIASGGFTYFTEHLKQQLGLAATFANQLEIKDGRLTGKVLGDVVDAQVKADVVMQLAEQHQIDVGQTVAMGDGANDLLMLNQAALGVAFHAKPVVRQQASAAVNVGGLDQLLYLLLPTSH